MPIPSSATPEWRVIPLLIAGLSIGACAEPDDSGSASTLARWEIGPESVRIGTVAGGPQALTSVGDLELGSDGAIYLAQGQEGVVKVFERSGALLQTLGSEGDGPGEFRSMSELGWWGDTLWVTDIATRRITSFLTSGDVLASLPYPEPASAGDRSTSVTAIGPDGSIFMNTGDAAGAFINETTGERKPLILTDRTGSTDRVVGTLNRDREKVIFIDRDGDQVVGVAVHTEPFGDFTLEAGSGSTGDLALVDRVVASEGMTPTFRVTKVAPSGDTLFSTVASYTPVPVPSAVVDSIVSARAGDPNREDGLRDALFLPDTYPPASNALIARNGEVWVARERVHRADIVTWEIFSAEGVRSAEIELPKRFFPLLVTDEEIWGTETDDLDVPYVVAYPVLR